MFTEFYFSSYTFFSEDLIELIIICLLLSHVVGSVQHGVSHRLSINRPTKRGKENSRSDGHCQCEKEMEDHLLACQ
jgi:hypothetical protein